MADRKLVAIPCKLAPGMFSGELVFTVTLADAQVHQGISPRHFCWNAHGQPIAENEVRQETAGKVAAKVVEDLNGGQLAVEVPDGEVIAVRQAEVFPRPTAIAPPRPSALSETNSHVPV